MFSEDKWIKRTTTVHNFSASAISFSSYDPTAPLRFVTGGGDNLVKFWRLNVAEDGQGSVLENSFLFHYFFRGINSNCGLFLTLSQFYLR